MGFGMPRRAPGSLPTLLERTVLDRLAAERAKFFHFVRRRMASAARRWRLSKTRSGPHLGRESA
jgi:hypothetical protein